jgi:hypothetical protein
MYPLEVLTESFAVVMAFLGNFGLEKALVASGFGVDFFRRKNEPICYRLGTS